MNKKVFTLLVALFATISFGAFAQITAGGVPGQFIANTAYLLGTAGVNSTTVLSVDANGTGLIEVTTSTLTNYEEMRKALWYVKATKGSTAAVPATYVFTNLATGAVLAFNSEAIVNDPTNVPAGANALGGDLGAWIPSDGVITPKVNQMFYVYADSGNPNEIIALTKVNSMVVPALYSSLAGATAALRISPFEATGNAPLTANDLNTQLGKTGVYDAVKKGLVATAENFFQLNISPDDTEKSPFNHSLQARAVERWETKYGTNDTKFWQGQDAAGILPGEPGYDSNTAAPAQYISMKPKGEAAGDIRDAYQDDNEMWFALYSRDADAYLFVDTIPVPGTDQLSRTLYQISTGKLYDAKDKDIKYRMPESYLFRFEYDASKNAIVVVSKAFPKKQARVSTPTTENAAFYSGDNTAPYIHAHADAYNKFNPVREGSEYPNTLSDAARTAMGSTTYYEGDAYVNARLTVAKLASSVAYVFGEKNDDITVKLGIDPEYVPFRIKDGAYLLKVVNVNNPFNFVDYKERKGKYIKMSLNGKSEFVEEAPVRQKFQNMPSAQWIIETTGSGDYTSTKLTNREFAKPFDCLINNGNNIWRQYFNGGLTYQVKGEDGKVIPNQFFFMNGDTIEFIPVEDPTNKWLGYNYEELGKHNLNSFTIRYLHDLAMDKPVNAKSDKDSAVWVDTKDEFITFKLDSVLTDQYGYNGGLKGVAQLERVVYKVKVLKAKNMDLVDRYLNYDKDNKKYYLKKKTSYYPGTSFLFKENNYDKETKDHYYVMVEPNFTDGYWNDLVRLKDVKKTAIDGVYTHSGNTNKIEKMILDNNILDDYYVFAKKTIGKDPETGKDIDVWEPYVYESEAFSTEAELNQAIANAQKSWQFVISKNVNTKKFKYYNRLIDTNYAKSKVAVDNNTLDLVYSDVDDASNSVVPNSAFKFKNDEYRIYRRLGDYNEEKEDVDTVKIYRSHATEREYLFEDANSVYSTSVNGPNDKTRKSQINFLGIEGKGDTKNSAMILRYVSGDVMPQYLIYVAEKVNPADPGKECPEHGFDCIHAIQPTKGSIEGRFLINLCDSIEVHADDADVKSKFQLDKKYARLAFVDAKLEGDSLIIKNSIYTGNDEKIKYNESTTWASKDTIDISKNQHNPVLFQFRFVETDNKEKNDFFIETESFKDGKPFAGGIAPTTTGGWVKVLNGVPAVINSTNRYDAFNEAEIFNFETTKEEATSNTGIEAGVVSVVAGEGTVTIKGAAGKQVVVANILGQVVANTVLNADEETISVPAGVVVVAVDGEATKALVK